MNQQEIDSLAEVAISIFKYTPPCNPIPEMIGWKAYGTVVWILTERDYRQDN